jgi:hypothetical protein
MPKSIPQLGDSNWGTPLNAHISQLQNPANGAINSFEQFSQRPTNLTLDDKGKTYLYTQTGNIHQWNGNSWKVLNESVINVKDYGAVGDGVVDDTAAIRLAITNAKSTIVLSSFTSAISKSLYIPQGVFIVSGTLEVTALHVFGHKTSWIKATEAEFDVFASVSDTKFEGFSIHGGALPNDYRQGQKGNAIYVKNPTFGNVKIDNLFIHFAKECGIKLENVGYGNISACTINACYLHCIYLKGTDFLVSAVTTIVLDKSTAVSDAVYGYGVKIENGINITFDTFICENCLGILVSGRNQTINFLNCYQENITGKKFLVMDTGASVGFMNIIGNQSIEQSIDYNPGIAFLNAFGNLMGDPGGTGNINGGIPRSEKNGMVQGTRRSGIGYEYETFYTFNRLETIQQGFSFPPLTLGTYKIWIDATGKPRIKNGLPTSDTDGTLVGEILNELSLGGLGSGRGCLTLRSKDSGAFFNIQNANIGNGVAKFGWGQGSSSVDTPDADTTMSMTLNNLVGIGTSAPTSKLQVVGLPIRANNTAALQAGLTVGAFYHNGDGILRVVF